MNGPRLGWPRNTRAELVIVHSCVPIVFVAVQYVVWGQSRWNEDGFLLHKA